MAKSSKSILQAEITAAAIGAAVGGVLGALFSPASGKANRKAIAKEGKKLYSSAKKAVQHEVQAGKNVAKKVTAKKKK